MLQKCLSPHVLYLIQHNQNWSILYLIVIFIPEFLGALCDLKRKDLQLTPMIPLQPQKELKSLTWNQKGS